LYDVYGEEFEKCILAMKKRQAGRKQSKQELWEKILESQIETGTPCYIKMLLTASQIKRI
jgi:ribonucleoside-diphosphate reductase alpha chain